jgi:fibronectin-binding autotransporter adhesin
LKGKHGFGAALRASTALIGVHLLSLSPAFLIPVALLALGAASPAMAQNWQGATGDFNTSTNWSASFVPGAANTAIFQDTGQTAVSVSANTSLSGIRFDAGAQSYNIRLNNDMTLLGSVVNNSLAGQTITVTTGNTLFFDGSAASGQGVTYDVHGGLAFNGNSVGGGASTFNILSGGFVLGGNARTIQLGALSGGGGTTVRNFSPEAMTVQVGSRNISTTFGGSFSSPGGGAITLEKVGAGTLTITGANTLGATTITAGTLQLGNGGTLGSGAVTNNAVLEFSPTGSITFGNTISGNGRVNQAGTGTTILTANNSYSDTTTISGGTLRIGNGGTDGTLGTGAVVNNSVLAFNRSDTALVVANAISGTGQVHQTGSGTTTLTGALSYTGGTTVSGGTLQFGDGTSGGSNNLSGNIAVTGGSLAINTPATVSVTGDVSLSNGTSLSIVSSAGGPSLQAATVTLDNNVSLNLSGISDANGLDRIVIDTQSGISGDFGKVTVGGFNGTVDYLTLSTHKSADDKQYLAAYGLSWTAGNNLAHGTFTLTNAPDTFNVGVALADQAANPATGWNGTTLTKAGGGTLILTGANTYSGGTIISAGTLQLGDGGTVGSIIGDVANNGTLAFNRSDSVTFAGAISGNGATRQIGVGTLILTGANTYAGGTFISGGTLQLGNGGTTGSIIGDVTNNGTLAFNRADSITFGGVVSGSGAVNQAGSGTTILTGANTYTGGTFISGGTLQLGDGGTTGSIIGEVTNNGTLAFNRSDSITFGNTISGTGTVNQAGSGTTILTGANTYAGGTFISAGTLQLGNGGTVGRIIGNVANNGTLAFNRSDSVTFAGAISGNGATQQIGLGTLILTGANAYAGGTFISGGTLQLGNGGTTGSIIGDVTNNGTLAFNRSDVVSFAGAISGTGAIRQIGAGLTELTGDSSGFAGLTTVEAGTLAVNGRLGGSLAVLTSGRLQGTGTVGDTSVFGTIAPGNSIGTLNVAGNITFNAGSTYEVEVNAAGQSDRMAAAGTATINGGTVQVLAGAGNYAPATTYTILTANGGRSGTFASVTSNLAFLDPTLSYDPTSVYLTMTRNETEFANVGWTRNQRADGRGVESLGFGNPIYNAVLNLSDAQARAAFDSLSGEVHASAKTALIEDSHFVRDAATDRIRAAFGDVAASSMPVMAYGAGGPQQAAPTTDRFALWGQGFGAWGHTDSDGNAARLNTSTGGFLMGADAPVFNSSRLGVLAGYSRTNFDVKDRSSSGSSDNYHLGLYGGTQWGNLGFRSGVAYSWHDISTSRSVAFSGFGDSLKGKYKAGTLQAFGELGYRIDTAVASFEPVANLAYVNLDTDSFSEQGGAAALHAGSKTTGTSFTTLGLRASKSFMLGGVNTTARGTLGWRHAFGDTVPLSTEAFATGDAFTVAGVPIARDSALIEAGLDMNLTSAATLGISYQGQSADSAQQQGFKANLGIKF